MTRTNLPFGDPRCGTLHGYKRLKCGCDDCRRANRLYQNRYLDTHPEQRLKNILRGERRRRAKRRQYG